MSRTATLIHFDLCHHCTTKTWKYQIFFFLSWTLIHSSLLEFNSRKNCQHLTNWTRWDKRDKVWSSANSLFKWHFLSRCHRHCLSALVKSQGGIKWLGSSFSSVFVLFMMKVAEGHAQSSRKKSQGCRLGKAKQALLLIKPAFSPAPSK